MPILTVTRRVRFSAAHRLHNPALSDAENRALFGPDNNPHGHGHNYALEVSVTGPLDDRSGYVMDLGALRGLVEREVVRHLDHHHLNADVAFLHGVIPTTENVVVACWRVLEPKLHPLRLSRLRLFETENNYVEYDGQ